MTNCTASNNTGTSAISVGKGSTLHNCVAVFNTVTNGIDASDGCSLTGCSAISNTCTFGFNASAENTFSHCAATSNTSGAATSAGFNAGFSSKFTDCTASLNATSVSPGTNSTGIGFNIGSNSIIQGCTADGNIGDGIRATFDCFILHNQTSIGQIVNAAGIHVVNNFNRIEGNRVTAIGRGIQVDGTTNLIVRNHVIPQGGVGTVAYMIGPNNSYGPIVPLSTGGAAVNGDTATSTLNDAGGGSHPWANFAAH